MHSLQTDMMPKMNSKVQLTFHRVGERERQYVAEVLDAEFRTSMGSMMTSRLEACFAELIGTRFAISFINGTATLHAALVAGGVQPGDEVIVPPLTMASTTFAVLHAGAHPVFADVDPATWNIDPESVARHITDRTRAIVPVALFGLSPDMVPIMELAAQHELFVLEDAAECFLGDYRGKRVGGVGHAASFSFQSSKHLTAGEGGMITTSDPDLADRIRRFGSLGYASVGRSRGKITKETIQDPAYHRHSMVGWNYRMPELCAAVALAQVERAAELVAARVRAATMFQEVVGDCSWLTPQFVPEGHGHTYWTYAVRLINDGSFSWYDFRREYVKRAGHGVYAAWQLTYLEPFLRGQRGGTSHAGQRYDVGLCPVAEAVQPTLLQFPTNFFDSEEAERSAAALGATIAHFGR